MKLIKKVLLKFSGEAFGDKGGPILAERVKTVATEIKNLRAKGVRVAVVCGGGNISRWKDARGKNIDRVAVDYKGMKGTFKNVTALEKTLKTLGIKTSVFASFALAGEYPAFSYPVVKKAWDKGNVIIFAGGTGYPFFSTDMSAVLYSLILNVDLFIKATKVDGVYTSDPKKHPSAKKFEKISSREIVLKNLAVIDSPAICLAGDNNLPIKILQWESGAILKVIKGGKSGTIIG